MPRDTLPTLPSVPVSLADVLDAVTELRSEFAVMREALDRAVDHMMNNHQKHVAAADERAQLAERVRKLEHAADAAPGE